jgi:hypothetical protein
VSIFVIGQDGCGANAPEYFAMLTFSNLSGFINDSYARPHTYRYICIECQFHTLKYASALLTLPNVILMDASS